MSEAQIDQHEWYERLARRTGGYRKTWRSEVLGESGETAFEERLFGRLDQHMRVLDAGCGCGEFTLQVALKVAQVTGIDFAENMIAAARQNAHDLACRNVEFVHATTHDLPFVSGSFDLVYSRRGPTSILLYTEILKPGGLLLGVHSEKLELVRQRLAASGLQDVTIEEFEAREVFSTLADFSAFWSRMPGHPDYSAPVSSEALARLAARHRTGNELVVPERRFVWQGRKPMTVTGASQES